MSRVVQSEEGRIFVFAKGADSAILERCVEGNKQIEDAVDHFANQGFRTLTFGFRELNNIELLD